MIFADKLTALRKKAGWSQEDLAEQMNVSRQSVSKWEGAQSIPDLAKIIQLSALFGVSTDYLLKDEIEDAACLSSADDAPSVRRISMEDANAFLAAKSETASPIAYGVFLCIISPICLILLSALSETPPYTIPENIAAGVGMIVLLAFIAIAVAIFLSSGSKTSDFSYLETETFDTEYGIAGMVKDRMEQYKPTYTRNNIIGAILCITAFIPLFLGIILNENNDLLIVSMLSVSFFLVGIGVICFVRVGVIWGSFQQILQEGDYSKEKKEKHPVTSAITTIYWLVVTTIYLIYSLTTQDWGRSWIIWAAAAILFPAALGVYSLLSKEK